MNGDAGRVGSDGNDGIAAGVLCIEAVCAGDEEMGGGSDACAVFDSMLLIRDTISY